mgnify:CR=1 FL=1
MEQLLTHRVNPSNNKGTWYEQDTIDYVLDFDNRALIGNTVRFEAKIQVYTNISTPTRSVNTAGIYLDPLVGGHSVIQNINTSTAQSGLLENLSEYNRLVKMRTVARKTHDDVMNAADVCELKSPHYNIGTAMTCQKSIKMLGGGGAGKDALATDAAGTLVDPDFSIKLNFCLNQVGDGTTNPNIRISYTQTGSIRISLILERFTSVLNGRFVTNDAGYTLTEPVIKFMSAPDQASQKISMRSSLCLKSQIASNFNNVSSNVPAVCDSMSISFIKQDQEQTVTYNNLQLMRPPNVQEISYLFNDAENKFISFQIKDDIEMIARGLESLRSRKSTALNVASISGDKTYLLGLNWGQMLDLSKQKFNVQLKTNIGAGTPYSMFQFFHSVISI